MDTKKKPTCGIMGCIRRFDVKRHYFRFPKQHDRWLKWVEACKRFDLLHQGPQYAYDNKRLCHLHFEKKLYKINKFNYRLHPDAVPTLLLGPSSKQDYVNEITEQDVFTEEEELHNDICAKETVKVEEEDSDICAKEAVKVEKENSDICAKEDIKVEKENSHICAKEDVKVEKENSDICAKEDVKVEKENSHICAKEGVKVEKENSHICAKEVVTVKEANSHICAKEGVTVKEANSNVGTSKIILPTYRPGTSNFVILLKPCTSAEKPANVTTKKLLADIPTEAKLLKLRKRVNTLQKKVNALRQTIRRLRLKETKKKQIVTSREDECNNLKKLGRKLLPENFNRILAAQIDAQFKDKHGRRYDSQFKKFALSLFFLNPQNYKELEKLITLPSVRTLQLFRKKLNS